MSRTTPAEPILNPKTENLKILGWAGGGLFALGLIAAFLAFIESDPGAKSSMVLNATILLSLGYPMLLHVQSLRKIATLEQRIRELEQRSGR